MRARLHAEYPAQFPYGHQGIDVRDLASCLFPHRADASTTKIIGSSCFHMDHIKGPAQTESQVVGGWKGSIRQWYVHMQDYEAQCDQGCNVNTKLTKRYNAPPSILVCHLGPGTLMSKSIKVKDNTGGSTTLSLRGVIYLGGNHFTARLISVDKSVWYYDGKDIGEMSQHQGALTTFTERALLKCGDRRAVSAFYVS